MPRPRAVAVLAASSWLAVVAAAWSDRGHDPLSDYVSWLSDGPHWWLGALGIVLFAAACAVAAVHLHRVLPTRPLRQAAATPLACSAVLALATVLLPSRGRDEPEWRTMVHVGLAVGGYAGVMGAAGLVAWLRGQRRVEGPRMVAWAGLVGAALAFLAVASIVARLTDGPDLRGLAQLGLLATSAAWLAAAGRVRGA